MDTQNPSEETCYHLVGWWWLVECRLDLMPHAWLVYKKKKNQGKHSHIIDVLTGCPWPIQSSYYSGLSLFLWISLPLCDLSNFVSVNQDCVLWLFLRGSLFYLLKKFLITFFQRQGNWNRCNVNKNLIIIWYIVISLIKLSCHLCCNAFLKL